MSNPGGGVRTSKTAPKSSIALSATSGGSGSSSLSSNSRVAARNQDPNSALAEGVAAVGIDPTRLFRPLKQFYPEKDGDFREWVQHLEHYFSVINCYQPRKTRILLYSLSYEASCTTFYFELTDNTNYDEAKEALMQYISQVKMPEESRTKLH